MSKYIIVIDTWADGIQAIEFNGIEEDKQDDIIFYSTEEEAMSEIMDDFEELTKNQKESGQEIDEYPTAFVMKLEDHIEGHKTIWKG